MELECIGAIGRGKLLKPAAKACKDALAAGRLFSSAYADALRLNGNLLQLAGKERAARQYWNQALTRARKLDSHYLQGQIFLDMGRLTGNELDSGRGKAILKQLVVVEETETPERVIA